VSRAVGIDLGTSNSAVAILDRDGAPRILTTLAGATTLPSVVSFGDDEVLVGEPAQAKIAELPDRTVAGAKRLLGRRCDDPEVRRLARALPYPVVAADNGDAWLRVGDRVVAPEEVSALVLFELRAIAERFLREPIGSAVITVPAWFDAAQRQATKDAAAIAGLEVRRLLGEPVAAALGHGAHRGQDRRYVVCDLGGGTFDVAIVDVEHGVFEVLSCAGDAFLGGDDIDRLIVDELVREVRSSHGLDLLGDSSALVRMRAEAQRVKHALSLEPSADVRLPALARLPSGRPIDIARPTRREELEQWSAPILQRLEAPCREAMARAGRTPDQVDEILLVGGMTRMPAVRRRLAQIFGKEPRVVPNPDEVVAIGAAIEVAVLDGAVSGVLLLDVTARGLGLSVGDGPCDLVIAPSAVVPTRDHRVITTSSDSQKVLEFDLWEGESAQRAANRHLGRYAVEALPDAPAGEVLVLVELTVDTDGTARASASELVSGERLDLRPITHTGLARAEVRRLARSLAAAR
jgi:molecular chaperone DnaK